MSKDDLLNDVWRSLAVSESALTRTVTELRHALDDDADHPTLLETIAKRGYRLIGDVTYLECTVDSRTRRSPRVLTAGIAGAGALIVAALLVAQYVRARAPVAVEAPTVSVRSIAVLPFDDLSAGRGDEQYADGLTEALIAELSTLDGFDKVIGRQTVARFRTSPLPLTEAARVLGVDAIVTASVLRLDGRLRVTARLVDGSTERHLWAATYERPDGEVLLMQREIVEAIASAVQLTLGSQAVARMPRARAVAGAAFEAYIAGRQAANAGPLKSIQAIPQFEHAIALDPEFAPAHAALASAFWQGSMHGVPALEAYRKGKAAAARAIALDPNMGEAHAAAGLLAFHGDWNWVAADASLRRAVGLSPNSAMVRAARAHYLVLAARYDEALDEARRSVELDPSAYFNNGILAWASFHARRYPESVRRWRQADEVGLDPVGQGIAIVTLAMAGQADEVRTRCPAAVTGPLSWRCAQGHALLGHKAPARLALTKAPEDMALLSLAELHAAVADPNGAVRALERAYDSHDAAVLFMNGPVFDPVRQDASFRNLQRRMNYPALVEGEEQDDAMTRQPARNDAHREAASTRP